MKKKKKGLLTKAMKAKLRNSRDDREILENLAVASKELDADDLYLITGGAQYEAQPDIQRTLHDLGGNVSEAAKDAISALLNNDSPVQAVIDGNGQDHQGGTFAKIENGNVAIFSEDGNGITVMDGNLDINHDGNFDINHVVNPDINHDGNLDENLVGVDAKLVTGEDGNIAGVIPGQFHTGDGGLTLDMDQAAQRNAEISVDAGDGFDVMTLFGNPMKHSFSFQDGKFQMK